MRAIITVIGKDMVGILAKVSTICAEYDVNVVEVTQSILQDLFASTRCTRIFSTACITYKLYYGRRTPHC